MMSISLMSCVAPNVGRMNNASHCMTAGSKGSGDGYVSHGERWILLGMCTIYNWVEREACVMVDLLEAED